MTSMTSVSRLVPHPITLPARPRRRPGSSSPRSSRQSPWKLARDEHVSVRLDVLLARVEADHGSQDGMVDLAIIRESQAGFLYLSKEENHTVVNFTENGLEFYLSYVDDGPRNTTGKQSAINEYLEVASLLEPVMTVLSERASQDVRLRGVESLPELVREHFMRAELIEEEVGDILARIAYTEECVQRLKESIVNLRPDVRDGTT
ncbi:hypothetical protein FKP32DRAFT_1679360 [Trametes sanguinea]|nr:hypothetical protein FKP32DRAFT_1679360 [Trametes sanguinea]